MQLKDQKSEPTPIEKVSNPADLAEEILDDRKISSSVKSFTTEQADIPSPRSKKKIIKLTLLIGLPISFIVGLGAILILLPTQSGCGNKARQAEARNNIGIIGRGQQAYFLENNKFASSIPELGIGISPKADYYQYFVQTDNQLAVNYAQSTNRDFKSYLGVTFVGTVPNSDRAPTTQSIVCEVNQPQPLANIMPIYQNGTVSCPKGTKLLGH